MSPTTPTPTTTSDLAPHDVLVLREGDDGWDAGRAAFNLSDDQRPAAITLPRTAPEVADAIAYAGEHGLRVAVQRTGHNATPLGDLSRTLLLRTDRMRGVSIDAGTRRARVRAGARWEDVVGPASELGLAALHGSTPDVSVLGYTLGGGMGWYARSHGLATNHVTAIEIVTADGRLRRVGPENDADLFWALRGGGGSFGVVTEMEFSLFAMPAVHAGALFFPWERAGEILHAWHAWTATVPDEVTSVGRILQFPPFPEIPEPLRGNAFVLVEAVVNGLDDRAAAELLAPLRALGPVLDTFAQTAPVGISELHMDPRDPIAYSGEHRLLGELPAEAIDDLVALAGPGSGSPMLSIELRHLGGALGRSAAGHGALAQLEGAFCLFAIGVTPDEAAAAALHAHFARVTEALAPYECGRYLNFTEQAVGVDAFFDAPTLRRLRAVKAAVDPTDLFHANHQIAAR
jgi:FAD/FMN-containing dehydrogenase